jgi:UDP-N-acetylmuramate--alanine ligase
VPDEPLDLSRPRRVHVVAVGGSGMGPIAQVLAWMGHSVTGSHEVEPPNRAALEAAGVRVVAGHDRAHVGDAEVLAVSTAVPQENPEVVEAHRRGLPVLARTAVLGGIARQKPTIAVAGTHGKTTTSALVATVLDAAGVPPSFVLGADVLGLGGSARWSASDEWFVVEADESDGTFLALAPAIGVVTNVEPDHLEHWGGFDALVEAFEAFLAGATHRIACADDEVASRIARDLGATTYGLSEGAWFRIDHLERARGAVRFTLHAGDRASPVAVAAPGVHNARNAAAAVAAAVAAGVPFERATAGLAEFRGVARRFEPRGEAGGVTFVDSYDHLPTEVAAVLRAARDGGWQRVVCVFQPHRYSRTQALWREFADAFVDADVLAITDVYPAGERPREGVTGHLILGAVLDAHPATRAAYLPDLDDVVRWLPGVLRPGDLCLTLGAGDVTTLPDRVMAALGGAT